MPRRRLDRIPIPAADRLGGTAAAKERVERLRRKHAAAAALDPLNAVLKAKAEGIVEQFQANPGLRIVVPKYGEGIVEVTVDDMTLYHALLKKVAGDPEVIVNFREDLEIIPVSGQP